jgi:NADPH:quinone reductase-like Zn-dependent oxidoreductase
VKIHVGQSFSLRDAAQAHREVEAGRSTGAVILIP